MSFDMLPHVGGPALATHDLQAGEEGLGVRDGMRLETRELHPRDRAVAFRCVTVGQHDLAGATGMERETDAALDVELDRGRADHAFQYHAFFSRDHAEVRGFAGLFAQPAHRRQRGFGQRDVIDERLAEAEQSWTEGEPLLAVAEQVAVRDEGLRGAIDEVGRESELFGDLR